MEAAREAMSFAGPRVTMVQARSLEAVHRFPDKYFDWLYIDALHTEEAVLSDLRGWWPKLRAGGLLTGDDYGDENVTDFVTVERYAKSFTTWNEKHRRENTAKRHHWGVMRATQQFAREMGIQLHITWLRDCYHFPAWYMVKPRSADTST